MGIQLREKKLGSGQVSLYLDIYHNKKRWYEFLDIHISKIRLTEQDKEKKLYAQQIKIKRENELIVEDNGKGIQDNSNQDGHGLLNINSRLNTINGQVNFAASENAGTTATIRVLMG